MKREDARVQFTKKQFQDALLRLMMRKSASQITVTDLCREAGLNRGTFYLHYGNPIEVLEQIEDDFLERNLPYLRDFLVHRRYEGNFFSVLMEHLESEKELMLMLMGPNGSGSFHSKYSTIVHEITMKEWKKIYPGYPEEHLEFLFQFSCTGFGGIILNYFNGTLNITEKELQRRMRIMGIQLMQSLNEF